MGYLPRGGCYWTNDLLSPWGRFLGENQRLVIAQSILGSSKMGINENKKSRTFWEARRECSVECFAYLPGLGISMGKGWANNANALRSRDANCADA